MSLEQIALPREPVSYAWNRCASKGIFFKNYFLEHSVFPLFFLLLETVVFTPSAVSQPVKALYLLHQAEVLSFWA